MLEMSLAYYLERTGHLGTLQSQQKAAREKKGGTLSRGWHPTLTEMLKYVVAEDTNIIGNANLLKALRKFLNNQSNDYLSVETLHLLVHNQHFYANEDTLRGFWPPLQGLFEIILVEPDEENDDTE
jgi:hypothetical protein